jgi:hypothetical protein
MLMRLSPHGELSMAAAGHAPLPAHLAGLFADGGPGRTLSVALPAGQLVGPAGQREDLTRAPDGRGDPGVRAAFWVSDGPATAALWTRLRAEHGRSGLWPLLLEDLGGVGDGPAYPWLSGGQASAEPVSEIDGHNVAGFLAAKWPATVPLNEEWLQESAIEFLQRFGRDWPGPAAPGALIGDPGVVADRCAERAAHGDLRLGLVPVSRGADALVATGWIGAANYFDRMSELAAIVRSWEDRFGARVVGLGCDTARLSVAAPPVTFAHALHVAAEHLLVCSDNVEGVGTLAEYAEQLRGETTWSFWWG